jgi:HK97 family phage portal protein
VSIARFFSGLLAGRYGPSVDPNESRLWSYLGGSLRTDTGIFVSERLALNLTSVQACVGLISDTMAMTPAAVEIQNRSGSSWQPVDDDPREHLLNVEFNPYMTPIVGRRTIQTIALLWGNGQATIARNSAGQGVELWPTPAGAVTAVLDRPTGAIRYRGSIDGAAVDLPPDEIVHLRGSMSLDGINALSPIAEARQAVGLAVALEKFGGKLFANDLRSGGYLEHPQLLSDKARKNLTETFAAQGGLDNAHGVKLLEEGLKFTPGSIPPEDAQFLGTREFTVAEFARMFRVPLELLASQGKTSSWGSGIEQLFLAFVQWTLKPWLTQWEQELSTKLLTTSEIARGMRVRFQVKELLRGDSAARSAFYERMRRIGAMSVNEIRAEEGRNPVDGGDDMAPLQGSTGRGDGSPPDPSQQEADRLRKQESA